MSELLIELFSEEIPARMQQRAADDLRRLVVEGMKAQGLSVGEARTYATPRRLTLLVDNVPAGSAAVREEKKGPRVGAPDAAIQGFLKGAGYKSLSEALIHAGIHTAAKIKLQYIDSESIERSGTITFSGFRHPAFSGMSSATSVRNT